MQRFLFAVTWLVLLFVVKANLPDPTPADFSTVGHIDTYQDIELRGNHIIPDSGELNLPITVPTTPIAVSGSKTAKVAAVSSTHADGSWGVGETIDIEVEFTSPVDVKGVPALKLLTG